MHSIQDGLGAHSGIRRITGHALSNALDAIGVATSVDRVLGDAKFIRAALVTLHTMSSGRRATLTSGQVNDLIQSILNGCEGKGFDFKITWANASIYAGGGGPNHSQGYYPYHYYLYDPFRWLYALRLEVVTVEVGPVEN